MNSKSLNNLIRTVTALLLFFCCGKSYAQYGFDTVRVYFDIGSDVLTKEHRVKIDSVANSIVKTQQRIAIYGYADYLGKESPNQTLSDRRANTVKDYLLQKHGYSEDYILSCAGVGMVAEANKGTDGNIENRRVDIYVKRQKSEAPAIVEPQKTVADNPVAEGLASLKPNQTLVLDNINFFPSSHHPLPKSLPVLKDLLATLESEPRLKIQIEGHICCLREHYDGLDTETGEMNLSEARARYIYDYLIQEGGVDSSRLSFVGFGRKYPLIENEMSEADAVANRRVEIRIIAK